MAPGLPLGLPTVPHGWAQAQHIPQCLERRCWAGVGLMMEAVCLGCNRCCRGEGNCSQGLQKGWDGCGELQRPQPKRCLSAWGYVGLHLGWWLTATCRNAVPQEKLCTMAVNCGSALTEPVLPLQLKGCEKMSTPHPGEHPWVWVQAVGSAHCGGFGKGSVQPSQACALTGCSCPTCPHCTARGLGPARCSSQGGAVPTRRALWHHLSS